MRPHVFVLTDGGRSGGPGRLWLSHHLAAQTGAPIGAITGRHRDRDVFDALLRKDARFFTDWTAALEEQLCAIEAAVVVVDGWQMYNVAHDLVHVMGRVAGARASARLGRAIPVLDYDVVPAGLSGVQQRGIEAMRLELDDAALARKRHSSFESSELRAEVETTIALEGEEAQRVEILRRPADLDALIADPEAVAQYEAYGAERVAAGIYKDVIRWNEHVAPAVAAICGVWRFGRRSCGPSREEGDAPTPLGFVT